MVTGVTVLIAAIVIGIIFFYTATQKRTKKNKKSFEQRRNEALKKQARALLKEKDPYKDIFFLQEARNLRELAERSPTTFMLRMRKNCIAHNIPYPTGKVYRGKDGVVYHGLSNGHYGRKKSNDEDGFIGWTLFTYTVLLPLLDAPSAEAMKANNAEYISANGEITAVSENLGGFITPYTDAYASHYPDKAANISFHDLNDAVLPHVDDLPNVTDIAKETLEREHGAQDASDVGNDNDTRDFDNYSEDPDRNSGGSSRGSNHDSGDGGGCDGGSSSGGFDGGGD